MKKISNKWKNIIWAISGVVGIGVIVTVSYVAVKKDKYLQAYDISKQIFNKDEINKYVKIEPKENIKDISVEDFSVSFEKEHSLNSPTLRKYTNVTITDKISDYSIRMFNFIINNTENSLNFTIELRHKTTQELIIFQIIIEGFKHKNIEKLSDSQVKSIKSTFKIQEVEGFNIQDWINKLNNSKNPIEKTLIFSEYIRTTISKEYVLYIVDDVNINENKLTFKYKFWTLKYDRKLSMYSQTFSDTITNEIEI